MRKLTFAQATLEAMAEEMKKDDKVYVIGEDIARQGGVFGQFKGLSQEFPGRVIDSPISETPWWAPVPWWICTSRTSSASAWMRS